MITAEIPKKNRKTNMEMEMTKDELCDFLPQMESPPPVLLTAVRRATAGRRRRLRPTCSGLRCWAYTKIDYFMGRAQL